MTLLSKKEYTLDELSKLFLTITKKEGGYVTRVTLANGTMIEGTPDEVRKLLERIGEVPDPRKYYLSETYGEYLFIKTMNTMHLINAANKYYENWVRSLRSIKEPQMYSRMVIEGINDPTWLAIMTELNTRKS